MCIISNREHQNATEEVFFVFFCLHVCMKADGECLLWTGKKKQELQLNFPTLCASSAEW